MRKTTVVAACIFIAILVVAGLPQLSDAGVIYGCALKMTGALRIVSGPGKCTRYETAISWNQAGPQGPAGADGHSPTVSMAGDQITVDGIVTGPHLTGPEGPAGTGGVDGLSHVVMGNVDGNGIIQVGSTGNFQILKDTSATGVYHIRFTTQFTTLPICLCTIQGWALEGSKLASCSMPFFLYILLGEETVILRLTDGTTVDGAFSFICAEP
jgi:hypothetical protein